MVDIGNESDIVIINTCSVTEQANSECSKIVRKALRTSPNAHVIVTGCFAQLQPGVIARIPGVRAVVGTSRKMEIPNMLEEILASTEPMILVDEHHEMTEFVASQTGRTNSRTRAFIKIQDGCDYSCSFCTIPKARGPARAMDIASLKQALSEIANQGYHELVLSGINLGEYRAQSGERFVDVLRLINDLSLPYRVRISSIEPNTITDEVINQLSSSRVIVPHFHIPLQSGSSEILRSMRRRYSPSMYSDVLEKITTRIPDCGIGIDVITGFPGETADHFRETLLFLQSLPFTYLHVFTYSERSNTPATELPDSVPIEIRRERTNILRQMSDARSLAFARSQIGTKRFLLPEGYDEQTGLWNGWTENRVRVTVAAPPNMEKRVYQVLLESIDKDGSVSASLLEQPELVSYHSLSVIEHA